MVNALFSSPAIWFTVPALAGTAVFLLRLVLMLAGLGGHHGLGDHFGDAHLDHGGHDFAGGDGHGLSFSEVFSFQSIAAFAMGLGWAGLAALVGAGWPLAVALLIALAAGVASTALLIALFRQMRRLQSDGTARLDSAVGTEADVYLSIPERDKGRGQIKAVVSGRLRVLNAVSAGPAISAQSRVLVIRIADDHSAVVQPI